MREEADVIASVLVGTDREISAVCHELGIDYDWFMFWDDGYLDELIYQDETTGVWMRRDY